MFVFEKKRYPECQALHLHKFEKQKTSGYEKATRCRPTIDEQVERRKESTSFSAEKPFL
jgi:hypothetical protein